MILVYKKMSDHEIRWSHHRREADMDATLEALHRESRQPGLELDESEPADAIEKAADEQSTGAGAEESETIQDVPTDDEIDDAIVALEERAEEISRGDNADIQLEVDPE